MSLWAIIDNDDKVTQVTDDPLVNNRFSIEDGDWFPDDQTEIPKDYLENFREIPLRPDEAERIQQELDAGREVKVVPMPDYLGPTTENYVIHYSSSLHRDYLYRG